MNSIKELEVLVEDARQQIETKALHLADVKNDYNEALAHGSQDELEDFENTVLQFSGLHARAIKRHAALVEQLAGAEAQAKEDDGKAHKETARVLQTEIQSKLTAFAVECSKLSALSEEIYKDLMPKMREQIILARQSGVSLQSAVFVTPSIDAAWLALKGVANINQNAFYIG